MELGKPEGSEIWLGLKHWSYMTKELSWTEL